MFFFLVDIVDLIIRFLLFKVIFGDLLVIVKVLRVVRVEVFEISVFEIIELDNKFGDGGVV